MASGSLTELTNSEAQRARIRRIAELGQVGRLRHCVTVAVEIRGPADPRELRSRLNRVVARRPALGSAFDGESTHDLRGGTPTFRQQAVSGPDPESRWRVAMEIADFEAQRPFRPGEYPLVRGLLLTAQADRHLFILNFDQLVSDNWSANLVLEDFFEARDIDTRPDEYPAVWRARQDWLASPAGSAAIGRRRERLAGARLGWPVPGDLCPEQRAGVVDQFAAIDETVTEHLRLQVRQARGSLLAAAALALAVGLAEDPWMPLGLLTTLAGRESAAEQAVVGWFASQGVIPLPPRTGLVGDFAAAVRDEIFAALSDQLVPFELVSDFMPPAKTSGPTCALVFLPKGMAGGRQPELIMDGALVRRTAVDVCPTGADIDFFLMEDAPPMRSAVPAKLTAGVSTWSDVASQEAVGELLRRWITALAAVAESPWSSTPLEQIARRMANGRPSPSGQRALH